MRARAGKVTPGSSKGFLVEIAHYIRVEIIITVITNNCAHGSIDIQMLFRGF